MFEVSIKKLNSEIVFCQKKKSLKYICPECGKQYKQLKHELCSNCLQKENHIKKGEYQKATTDLCKEVLEYNGYTVIKK